MDQGHFVGMVLLDLQKAFDTVHHGILLMTLKALELSQDISRCFRSYLSDHQQQADNISCGVLQGSMLGPLFFLYMSMICPVLSVINCYMQFY